MDGLAREVNESHVDLHQQLATTFSKIKDLGTRLPLVLKQNNPRFWWTK